MTANYLNKNEIQIILNEIKEPSVRVSFLEYTKTKPNYSILDIILSNKNIINYIPLNILKMYEDELCNHYLTIFRQCNIAKPEVVLLLLQLSNEKSLSQDIKNKLIQASTDPLFLFKNHVIFENKTDIVNNATVKLPEKFILNSSYYRCPSNIFFMNQHITKKVFRKGLYDTRISYNYIKEINKALQTGIPSIDNNALVSLAKFTDINYLAKHYNLDKSSLKIAIIRGREENRPDFIKTILKYQNIPSKFLTKYIYDSELHYYLAFNNNVTDQDLITLFNKNKDLNWLYINKNINMSKHLKYIQELKSQGFDHIILANIENTIDRGDTVYNLHEIYEILPEVNQLQDKLSNMYNLDIYSHQ